MKQTLLEVMVLDLEEIQTRALELKQAIRIERIRIASEEFCISIGIIVTCQGEDYKIVEIQPRSYSHQPILIVNGRKKDGTWGIRRITLWSGWALKGELIK